MNPARWWVLAAAVLVLAAGCVSRTGPPVAADDPAPGTTTTTTTSTTTTTITTTTTPPLPAAADGTNVAACQDGDCEVAITGQVDFVVGTNAVSVIVEDGTASLGFALSSGTTGSANLDAPDASASWTDGATGQNTTVRLVGIDATTAVIEFSTA